MIILQQQEPEIEVDKLTAAAAVASIGTATCTKSGVSLMFQYIFKPAALHRRGPNIRKSLQQDQNSP
jgi:hypothetical protein